MVARRWVLVLAVLMLCRNAVGEGPSKIEPSKLEPVKLESFKLDAALGHIPPDARALVLIDPRLQELIAPELSAYVRAASARRKFEITVLPIVGLDDSRPPEVREAIQELAQGPAEGGRRPVRGQCEAAFVLHAPGRHAFDAALAEILRRPRDGGDAGLAAGLDAEFRTEGVQGAGARLRPDGPSLARRPGALGGLPSRRLSGRRQEHL